MTRAAALPGIRTAGLLSLAIGDYAISGGRIVLRKTGNSAAIDATLVREVATWLAFTLVVRMRGLGRWAARGSRPAIWFTPDRPHSRYLVRAAATWAGIRVAAGPAGADAAFFFEDATWSKPSAAGALPGFNFGCTDIGKTRVATVFGEVFGYPLLIDPKTWTGRAVAKSEANGAHDGRIVDCPRLPQPGVCYQRLIDTLDTDGKVREFRAHCIGRKPVLVWVKRRDAANRFLPPNVSAVLRRPADVFSPAEVERIVRFLDRMEADWCGLDILRDRDGRIYVVDVNKTDAGPIVALPFRQKLASIAIMAQALVAMVRGGTVHDLP